MDATNDMECRVSAMQTSCVSVVIPCFRQGKFLGNAVHSVLAQSHSNLEIIVVNDGSDDDTENVARGFGDRVIYISKVNGGLSSARNAGVDNATGCYLLFLDADDLLLPKSVENLLEHMEASERRIVAMGHAVFVGEPSMAERETGSNGNVPPSERVGLLPGLLRVNRPVHAYLCPRRLLIDAGKFDESLTSCEDWDMWLRIALLGAEYRTCSYPGALYRKLAGSMSSNRPRMVLNQIRIMVAFGWALLLADASLLTKCAPTLLAVLYELRLLRRWLALNDEIGCELALLITVLQQKGFRCDGNAFWRVRERLPLSAGIALENMCLAMCKSLGHPFYDQIAHVNE